MLTDDTRADEERQIIAQVILPVFDQLASSVYSDGPFSESESALEAADLLIASGFRREPTDSVSTDFDGLMGPKTIQELKGGEPSDVVVDAALVAYYSGSSSIFNADRMRAALRAAAAVQGTDKDQ